jgi:hypothetical protein
MSLFDILILVLLFAAIGAMFCYTSKHSKNKLFKGDTANWIEKDAVVVRLDYSAMKGEGVFTDQKIAQSLIFRKLPNPDTVVAVLEYKNDNNGKNTPVIILCKHT